MRARAASARRCTARSRTGSSINSECRSRVRRRDRNAIGPPRGEWSAVLYEHHDPSESRAGPRRKRVRRRVPRPHPRTVAVDADRTQGDARRPARLEGVVRTRSAGGARPGVWQRPLPDRLGPCAAGPRSPGHRHPTGRDPLRAQAGQPTRPVEYQVRGPGRARVTGEARRAALGRGNPLLSPAALLRPGEGPPATCHAGVRRECAPRAYSRRPLRGANRQPGLLEVHQGGSAVLLRFPRTNRPLARRPEGAHATRNRRTQEEAAGLPRPRDGEDRPGRGRGAEVGRVAPAADIRRRPKAEGFGSARLTTRTPDRPMIDLTSIPRLARRLGRVVEVARALAKYGLADALARLDYRSVRRWTRGTE